MLVTETGYEVLTVSAGMPAPPEFVTQALHAAMATARRQRRATTPDLRARFRDARPR